MKLNKFIIGLICVCMIGCVEPKVEVKVIPKFTEGQAVHVKGLNVDGVIYSEYAPQYTVQYIHPFKGVEYLYFTNEQTITSKE